MASSNNVDADPKEVEKAQNLWVGFTEMMKWSLIAIIAILVLMALFLL